MRCIVPGEASWHRGRGAYRWWAPAASELLSGLFRLQMATLATRDVYSSFQSVYSQTPRSLSGPQSDSSVVIISPSAHLAATSQTGIGLSFPYETLSLVRPFANLSHQIAPSKPRSSSEHSPRQMKRLRVDVARLGAPLLPPFRPAQFRPIEWLCTWCPTVHRRGFPRPCGKHVANGND